MFILLTLKPGPTLIYKCRADTGGTPKSEDEDVTASADSFLFERVRLDHGVTLADIFRLFEACPLLLRIYRRSFADQLAAEARKGAVVPVRDSAPEEVEGIEYLELSYRWYLDSSTNVYSTVNRLDLDGVGHVLATDAQDYGQKAGERIRWSVSLSPVRELLSLPVRVSDEVQVSEDDVDAAAYREVVKTVRCLEVTLGQVLDGLLDELSWHGGPREQQEVREKLSTQMDEIEADRAALVDADDIFEDRINELAGYEAMFETLGDVSRSEIRRAMRKIGDHQPVGPWFQEQFAGKVRVRSQYLDRGGREFRKAFRAAGR